MKKYGVWGCGVVGKSVVSFLRANAKDLEVDSIMVMDTHYPKEDEHFLQTHQASFVFESEKNSFFTNNDVIIPSPGIALWPDFPYMHKLQEELDLFSAAWQKPLIAVTGTVGKTSVVHLLSSLLENVGLKIALGGNIGTGMLDLVRKDADYALLELSSFQLERTIACAPDLAIITNVYPNHLDRHGTFESYFKAKYQILRFQNSQQKALVPWSLRRSFREFTDRPLTYFANKEPLDSDYQELTKKDTLYFFKEQHLYKMSAEGTQKLVPLSHLPAISYQENWLILVAACDMLGVLKSENQFAIPSVKLPDHRLEHVGTVHGLTFYNDSKSTLTESTLIAVNHLNPARIHLFLGGLSKGVDRATLVSQFKGKVETIRCFGAESDLLFNACKQSDIEASRHATLEDAFQECVKQAHDGDTILFSPAGSSYDLYKNYKERGDIFKKLVNQLDR